MKEFDISGIKIGGNNPFVLFAGPCVIESEETCLTIASSMKDICAGLGIPYIFKASYDKANRSSIQSYRGPGIKEGLRILKKIKKTLGLPIVTDVHTVEEVEMCAPVVDVLQIPAFLCRQTDLVVAAAKTGRPVNVKKGQFLAPWDIRNVVDKVVASGNRKIIITERGSSFGYNNLVVDFKALPIMRQFGYPVCFDVTHSVQLPGGAGTTSGGQREFAEHLMRAALAVGVDALFIETHPEPDEAMSDGPNMISIERIETTLKNAKAIDNVVKRNGMA